MRKYKAFCIVKFKRISNDWKMTLKVEGYPNQV